MKEILIHSLLLLDEIRGGRDAKSPQGYVEHQLKMKECLACTRRIAWAAQDDDILSAKEWYEKLKNIIETLPPSLK